MDFRKTAGVCTLIDDEIEVRLFRDLADTSTEEEQGKGDSIRKDPSRIIRALWNSLGIC